MHDKEPPLRVTPKISHIVESYRSKIAPETWSIQWAMDMEVYNIIIPFLVSTFLEEI